MGNTISAGIAGVMIALFLAVIKYSGSPDENLDSCGTRGKQNASTRMILGQGDKPGVWARGEELGKGQAVSGRGLQVNYTNQAIREEDMGAWRVV